MGKLIREFESLPLRFLPKTRYFFVAQMLEYFRAIARVPSVYCAFSRLELACFILKTSTFASAYLLWNWGGISFLFAYAAKKLLYASVATHVAYFNLALQMDPV